MRSNPHVAACSFLNGTNASFWVSRDAQSWADDERLVHARSSPAKQTALSEQPRSCYCMLFLLCTLQKGVQPGTAVQIGVSTLSLPLVAFWKEYHDVPSGLQANLALTRQPFRAGGWSRVAPLMVWPNPCSPQQWLTAAPRALTAPCQPNSTANSDMGRCHVSFLSSATSIRISISFTGPFISSLS